LAAAAAAAALACCLSFRSWLIAARFSAEAMGAVGFLGGWSWGVSVASTAASAPALLLGALAEGFCTCRRRAATGPGSGLPGRLGLADGRPLVPDARRAGGLSLAACGAGSSCQQ
jgi:hypothetical protein